MNNISLVIIDDSQQMKEMITQKFNEQNGFVVLEHVTNGEKAVEVVKDKNPDVVLLDLVVSGRDGMSILEDLHTLKNTSKVIVVTALTGDGFVCNAMQNGASYYILKPCTADDVERRIKDIMQEQKPQNEQQEHINSIVARYKNEGVVSLPSSATKIKSLDEKISNIFITVGIPAHIKGYQFLREAIKMAVDTPEIVNSITKKLYPNIATRFSTTPSKVERAIRHAIEVAWNRGKIENINSVFGLQVYNANEKPTNGEFIALVADKMIIEGC
ncbi:MAG: sporulation transcription factor Spo0A [Clostridia bacterium]|nr:sporulation transcription factor Spo0A [Clostridia bacterium]